MSFVADKKREHETAAEKALVEKDYVKAFFHTGKAAEFGFALAEQSDGKIAQSYVDDAFELLGIAEELKAKAAKQAPGSGRRSVTESGGDDAVDGKGWVVGKKPDVKMSDVKGLDEAKDIVADALINPIKHPDIYKTLKVRPGTGLLLYGPPGTGKSMFAKAIANELDATFMHVKLNELKSKYVGDSEKNVAEMFAEARKHERCVLFLDECEAILRKRGSQKIATVEQFLQEADGFTSSENQLFILLATNRPWLIDSAVTRSGRISASAYVNLPEPETRRHIIEAALEGVPLKDDVDIEQIVQRTEGFSGAELHHHNGGGICDVAANVAARRAVAQREKMSDSAEAAATADINVCWADFEQAFSKVIPVSKRDPDIIKRNREWSGESDNTPGEDDE